MSEDKNNTFERFFQEKLDEYEIDYRESDWENLEERLDRQDQIALLSKQNSLMRKRFTAAAILLLIALLGYFTYQNYSSINELEQELNNQTTEVAPSESNPDINQRNTDPEMPEAIADEKSAHHKSVPPKQASPNNRSAQQAATTDHTQRENELLVSKKQAEQLFISDLSSRVSIYTNSASNMERILPIAEPSTSGRNPYIASRTNQSSPGYPAGKIDRNHYSGFSVALAMAPDFSTAGSFSNFSNPGFKLGVGVEYNWNRNLAISLGLIRSNVKYRATGSEYKPPKGYWTNGIVPQETMAQCLILDIPIQIKYNFLQLDQSRFYAKAGISSYIMLNEVYQFDYDRRDYDSELKQSWSGKTRTRHWASNASLSVGYEFDLNSDLSIRAEPYLQIPLREVGWGNVDLYSVGTFISFNYKFK